MQTPRTPITALTEYMQNGRTRAVWTFLCPHCNGVTQQTFAFPVQLTIAFLKTPSLRTVAEDDFVFSSCLACGRETVFKGYEMIFPAKADAPVAAADMPADIKPDYDEARSIAAQSPRGAAALLRLVIQKLCPHLGAKEGDINSMIGELVAAQKISTAVQQALDTVRVIGNEAVHPGSLDLKDDYPTALALFRLVNMIVEKAITEPRMLGEIYGSLPAGKRAGIERRDGPKQPQK